MQKIGPSCGEQLLYFLGFDGSLQNYASGAKVAAPGGIDAVLTDVRHRLFEHAAAALWTGTEWGQARKIHFFRSVVTCLATKVKLRTELGAEPYHCSERFSNSAAESGQRAHRALSDQGFNLLSGKLAARHDLPDEKIAFLALELAIVFLHRAPALRARSLQGKEHGIGDVALLDAGNHLTGEIDDVFHERAARKIPVLHLLELEFPVPSELRRTQLVHPKLAQREKEGRRLRRRLEFATVAVHIVLVNQTLDDLRTGRRSTQSLLAHRFAQLLVLDQFSGAFHRREKRCLREAGRRLRSIGANIHVTRAHFLFLLDRDEAR